MSLNYDLGKIENYKETCFITAEEDIPVYGIKKGDRIMNPVTRNLIFATMAVGMGRLLRVTGKSFISV